MNRHYKITQLTRECDALAARFWQREASGRGQGYLEWLQKVRQVSDIIKENRPETFYFFGNELESANSNVSRRSARKKVEKSREK
tara:strand:+ start:289 stop:543 length:255 start_codon:yes stop_codon:yes gene_type:complete